jgi:RES domain-containing protein
VSQRVWRIASDTRDYEAHDLSGTGAQITGGRWNDKGVAMVYSSTSRALACLETIVHLNTGGLPLNRYLVEIEIPNHIWEAAQVETASSLSVGWDAEPSGRVSIAFGSGWAATKASALLLVPSVIVPEEVNVLINPVHFDAASITARKVRKWLYDPRIKHAT